MEAAGHRYPNKILCNKLSDLGKLITLFSNFKLLEGIDVFALVNLPKLGSRTAHEATLPQKFILLGFSSYQSLRGGAGDHLQFLYPQRTVRTVENR